MDYLKMITELNLNFASRRNSLTEDEKKLVFQNCPSHFLDVDEESPNTKDDDIVEIYNNLPTLIDSGQIVYAKMLQMNSNLFKNSFIWKMLVNAAPGFVIYSADPYFQTHPEALDEIANLFYTGEESLEEAEALMDAEMVRFYGVELPETVTKGRKVFITTIMFQRKHYPKGRMSRMYLPLVICPEKVPTSYILPDLFWSDEYKKAWKAQF